MINYINEEIHVCKKCKEKKKPNNTKEMEIKIKYYGCQGYSYYENYLSCLKKNFF